MPSYRIADAQRPRNVPPRFAAQRGGHGDPEMRRRQRERVIASLLAVPGKGAGATKRPI
jgi:hypothetical protein